MVFKYYIVYQNGTSVQEVSMNDFALCAQRRFKHGWVVGNSINEYSTSPSHVYSLPAASAMYYGYAEKATAMKRAKAGALRYMETTIAQIKQDIATLKKYREEHYEDLNITLLDKHIREVEREMGMK